MLRSPYRFFPALQEATIAEDKLNTLVFDMFLTKCTPMIRPDFPFSMTDLIDIRGDHCIFISVCTCKYSPNSNLPIKCKYFYVNGHIDQYYY